MTSGDRLIFAMLAMWCSGFSAGLVTARIVGHTRARRPVRHGGERVTTAPPEPKNRTGKPTAPLTGPPNTTSEPT